MKINSLIVLSMFCFACSSDSDNDSDSKIKEIVLSPASETKVFEEYRTVAWPSNTILDYTGVPEEISEYVVRNFIMQTDQFYYDQYKNGLIDTEEFKELSAFFSIDTTSLSKAYIDAEILVLIGSLDNKRVVLVDANNNNDFSDDIATYFKYPLTLEQQDSLFEFQQTQLVNFDYYVSGEKIQLSRNLKFWPYLGPVTVSYNTNNPIDEKYHLIAFGQRLSTGQFSLGGNNYKVIVSNNTISPRFTPNFTRLFVYKEGPFEPKEANYDVASVISDEINLDGYDFKIQKISTWGDTLVLKALGYNDHPLGITAGYHLPELNAEMLDQSKFVISDQESKYILFDFWGTWCKPCIESIPDLSDFKNDFDSQVRVVSVAWDKGREDVEEAVEDYNMDWEHIFVNSGQMDTLSMVHMLKVTVFPTTILVAPNGKIIARNKSFDEYRNFLNEIDDNL